MRASTVARQLDEPAAEEAPAKRLKFPTALTVLAIVLLVVWLASFFIPVGRYEIDPETGGPPGHLPRAARLRRRRGRQPCVDKSLDAQFKLLWRAPPNGLYGVENAENGYVGADEEGFLYGSAQIFFFVLAVGAFITDDDEDRRDRDRHRPARAALPTQPGGPGRRADVGVRPRRHDLRHVGGDARVLRAARPAGARARLRPHGRCRRSSSSAPAPACSRRPSTRSPPASPRTRPASASATASACAS